MVIFISRRCRYHRVYDNLFLPMGLSLGFLKTNSGLMHIKYEKLKEERKR